MVHGQKYALKKILNRYLPPEISNWSKNGFIAPVNDLIADMKNGTADFRNKDLIEKDRDGSYDLDKLFIRETLVESFK
tara:strand:+ start:88 stop:321 length:234 start_codon:yes stop_codon:yes gene_type:complete